MTITGEKSTTTVTRSCRVASSARAIVRVVAAKHARLSEPHVAPLVALADEIAAARALSRAAVPYPDPDTGGIHARPVFLLSTPGLAAKMGEGSGLLSLENDDPTAERVFHAYRRRGSTSGGASTGTPCRGPQPGRTPTGAEVTAGLPWLARRLALLPELRMVVLTTGRYVPRSTGCTCWPSRAGRVSRPGANVHEHGAGD